MSIQIQMTVRLLCYRYFQTATYDWIANRMKRVVKYRKGYDMWTYVAGEKRLPGKSSLHTSLLLDL